MAVRLYLAALYSCWQQAVVLENHRDPWLGGGAHICFALKHDPVLPELARVLVSESAIPNHHQARH
jgi:hypothetical protein